MPRVSPLCCVKFGVTFVLCAVMVTLLLRAAPEEQPLHRGHIGMGMHKDQLREDVHANHREDIREHDEHDANEIPNGGNDIGDGLPGGFEEEQHHHPVADKEAEIEKLPPSPPTTKANGYRFDANIPLELLGVAAHPSEDKNNWIREDEKIRHKALTNLSPEQERLKKEGYDNCQFNQFASDQLSLHRHARDTRHPSCVDKRYYPAANMPAVSVVIVFYNEARSTLLRTAWSVIDRTPPNLLKEVILVDDGSDKPHLKEALDLEVESMPKTHVLHVKERGGLIRAKVHGVENSTAEIIVFIDSHCEANDGWLEPMLDRIIRNRKIIAMPVIDVVDMNTFEVKQAIIEKGVFSWTQYFYWLSPSGHIMENKAHHDINTDPLVCPVMAGGIFAIDRDYFWESGAYDMGQDTWGGENMEMSFRLWMCGARLEVLPCSRIAHVFRSKSPYTFKDRNPGLTIAHNLNRVAEVWMDEYAEVYYNLTSNKPVGAGNVTARRQFRKDNNCKSFKWYLDNIAPYMFVPVPENYYRYGKLRNEGVGKCINHEPMSEGNHKVPNLVDCTQNYGHSVEWYLTKHPFDGELRHEGSYGSRCMFVTGDHSIGIDTCYSKEDGSDNVYWTLDDNRIKSKLDPSKCLAVIDNKVKTETCGDAITQTWTFVPVW
eukprot:m.110678 g.110678  ORF g.110678 m.110678 type:complete len:657 (-) comp28060_c0_seq1:214-2184(-)